MIDRIFSAALTFCMLIGGTLAMGSALFGLDRPAAAPTQMRVVQLEPVVVKAKRLTPPATVALGQSETGAARVQ